MAPLRALVVDDEAMARRNLTVLLRRHPDIGVIVECESGQAAIDEMRRTKPDILFLDVQMPECDGFDVLELMGPDMPAAVIFVTAYDEYALRAFDAGALDYLLKPFDDARFDRALQRAKSRLALEPTHGRRPITRLAVKSGELLRLPACRQRYAYPAPEPSGSRKRAGRKNLRSHPPLDHRELRQGPRTRAA